MSKLSYSGVTLDGAAVEVAVADGRVESARPIPNRADLPRLLPALVDLQHNGSLGVPYNHLPSSAPDALRRVAECLLRHGVGRVLATVPTTPYPALESSARALAAALDGDADLSDANPYAGCAPGSYSRLGGVDCLIEPNGFIHVAGQDILAGAWHQLDRGVAFLVNEVGLPFEDAWRMCSTVPAERIGLDLPRLRPGDEATFVVAWLDDGQLHIDKTVFRGREHVSDLPCQSDHLAQVGDASTPSWPWEYAGLGTSSEVIPPVVEPPPLLAHRQVRHPHDPSDLQ